MRSYLTGWALMLSFLLSAQNVEKNNLNILQLQVRQIQSENLSEPHLYNEIFIEQSGRGNYVVTNMLADDLQLSIKQNGSGNLTNLNLAADEINYSVWQEGSRNYVAEYNLGNSQVLYRLVQQKGRGNTLVIHGENSISDEMQVKMLSGNQTVIVRNFK